MLYKVMIVLFFFVLFLSSLGEAIDRDDYALYIRGAARTAVRVFALPSSSIATGFWVSVRSDTSKAVFITNKHVLNNAKQLKLTFQLSDKQRQVIDTSTLTVDLYSVGGDSLFSVVDNTDLAAIVIRLPYKKRENQVVFGIHEGAFTTLSDLYLGEEIIFFGYPLGRTVNQVEPILRSGRIGGIDSLENNILLDAQVFGGSSGSPVFVDEKSLLGNSRTFVGVISGFLPFYNKRLQGFDSMRTEIILAENSGLAIVLPAWEVAKVARLALANSAPAKCRGGERSKK